MPFMYKIFDDKGNSPATLYHGVSGKKKLPLNQYLIADRKIVKDAKGYNYYESGFHLLSTHEECAKYLTLFKNLSNKMVCQVYVPVYSSMWDKNTKRKKKGVTVKLAGIMCIFKSDWENRLSAKQVMSNQGVSNGDV